MPHISPRYPPDIPQICIRYPPFPQISPDFPQISPRYPKNVSPRYPPDITQLSPKYPSNYPTISPSMPKISPRYPHRYNDDVEFWSVLTEGAGVERDNHNACACRVISFNVFSNRYLLAQSLHVKCDGYFQSLQPEIVHL